MFMCCKMCCKTSTVISTSSRLGVSTSCISPCAMLTSPSSESKSEGRLAAPEGKKEDTGSSSSISSSSNSSSSNSSSSSPSSSSSNSSSSNSPSSSPYISTSGPSMASAICGV